MIAFLLLLAAAAPSVPFPQNGAAPPPASVDGLPIGALPRQALPDRGCAAYFWNLGPSHSFVAMSVADPALLRLAIDGEVRDFARRSQSGEGGFGFASRTEYARDDIVAQLDVEVEVQQSLAEGASVPRAVLRIDRAGRDTVIVPLAGLIGCNGPVA